MRVGTVKVTRGKKKKKHFTYMLPCRADAAHRLLVRKFSGNPLVDLRKTTRNIPLVFLFLGPDSARPQKGNPGLVTALNGCSNPLNIPCRNAFILTPLSLIRTTLPWQLHSQDSKEDCSLLRYKIPICNNHKKKTFLEFIHSRHMETHAFHHYSRFLGKCVRAD